MNHTATEEMGRRPLTTEELLQVRLERSEDPVDFLGIEYGRQPKRKQGPTKVAVLNYLLREGF